MPSEGTGDLQQTIAANIRRGMRAKGFSARKAMQELGVGETIMWKWRTGRAMPSARSLRALADLFFDGDVNQLYWPVEDSAA